MHIFQGPPGFSVACRKPASGRPLGAWASHGYRVGRVCLLSAQPHFEEDIVPRVSF